MIFSIEHVQPEPDEGPDCLRPRLLLLLQRGIDLFFNYSFKDLNFRFFEVEVIVVYNVSIVASRHGLLEKCWPSLIGCIYALQNVLIRHFADFRPAFTVP